MIDTRLNRRGQPLDEISRSLQLLVTTYSRVSITINALDECQVSYDCRTTFLSEMFSLQAKRGANVFAASRFIPEISEKFEGSIWLEIRASEEDILTYPNHRMSPQRAFLRKNLGLREKIKAKIVDAVKGMYVFASILIEGASLKSVTSNISIRSIRGPPPLGPRIGPHNNPTFLTEFPGGNDTLVSCTSLYLYLSFSCNIGQL